MKLTEIYKNKEELHISFETFPPKDNAEFKTENIKNELSKLMKYDPSLISVTYGAGGSTSANSINLVRFLRKTFNTEIMPHYTCVNATKDSVNNYLKAITESGIENILALRGDTPKDVENPYSDFKFASELTNYIKETTDLTIATAGYPETHPEATSEAADIDNLLRKIDGGAMHVFTQLFFDNDVFKRYYEKVKSLRPEVTIIPGILPVSKYSQITRMCTMNGTVLPKEFKRATEEAANDPEKLSEIGKEFAIEQIKDLLHFGIRNFHFYILNKSEPFSEIWNEITGKK